jgi:hypothetical protein
VPVSTRRYTELKLAISDYVQRRNWTRLLELCGTSDDETAKTIAVIFTLYDPRNIWRFLDYVHTLSAEERREKRDSVATSCYIIGKMGQSDTEKSLNYLRSFLADDHMLRGPVTLALSNLWVLETKKTSSVILKSWVLRGEDNDDLQEVGIKSSEFLAIKAPEMVASFLLKVASIADRKAAAKAAEELISNYPLLMRERRVTLKIRKKK